MLRDTAVDLPLLSSLSAGRVKCPFDSKAEAGLEGDALILVDGNDDALAFLNRPGRMKC